MEHFPRSQQMSRAFQVLLRIPPILLLDFLCMSDYVVSINGWAILRNSLKFLMNVPLYICSSRTLYFAMPYFDSVVSYVLYHLGLVASLVLFLQKSQNLMSFYFVVAAVGIVAWSYILNEEFIKFCSELLNVQHTNLLSEIFRWNSSALQTFLSNYMYQTFLAIVFSFTTKSLPKFPQNRFLFGVLFVIPTIVAAYFPTMTPFPSALSVLPFAVAVISLFDLICYCCKFVTLFLQSLKKYCDNIRKIFHGSFDAVYCINYLVEMWKIYQVRYTFQAFGLIRLLKNLELIVYDDGFFDEYTEIDSFISLVNNVLLFLHNLAVRSCDNIISIVGVSSVVAVFVEKFVWNPLQKLLLVPEDEQRSIFSLFSITVVTMALISGVTNLKADERSSVVLSFGFLMKALFLYELHEVMRKRLEVLSTMGNMSFKRHSRALVCCFIILAFCAHDCVAYIHQYNLNQWIVRSVICSMEIAVTLIISLVIYALNMVNLKSNSLWHDLYDYVYYLECVNSSFRFFLAFVIFIRGTVTLYEEGSLIKLIFVILHVYYNVFVQFTQGLQSWKSRCFVNQCIKSLPEVSVEEYAEVEVCAICYEEIGSHIVVGTRCNHFYHKYCLKRWLYNRRTCPMCHRNVIREEPR